MKYNAFISYSHAADGRLAPAVQLALEKFAKPWYKIRNLNIFRDEASLSATPHLWDNIQKALENSEYLIYMASPQSAASKWVRKEIEFWLEHRSPDNLLIVLTDGEIIWDDAKQQFSKGTQCALPESLQNTFKAEPFYLDLRAFHTKQDVSLKNSLFRKEILKLAAQLHGKAPKDMAGEEVAAHRRMILVRNGAIALLAVLVLLFVYQTRQKAMAQYATQQAEQAKYLADQGKELAEKERRMALEAKEMAEQQRVRADSASQEALHYRQMAEEQRIIAIQAKEMADQASQMSRVNSQLAQVHAREARVKWDLLTMLVTRGIAGDQALWILRKVEQNTVGEQYPFGGIDTIQIDNSLTYPSGYRVRFLGYNDIVITELDSLDIPSLR